MSATTCSSVKKRKIPTQKRETKKQRVVTFSKRGTGLFNKAAELCVLCNAQVVILVSAPLAKEKFYTFAHPNINLLLDTFLNNHVSHPINNYNNLSTSSSHQNMEQLTPNNNVSKTKKRKRESEEFWGENEDFDVYQTPEEVTSIIEKLENVRENVALKLQKLSTSNNQDINSSDHQNYHLGCFAEDIMNINNEYSKESGDQSQFMTSVVFQNLSTSTYHGSCIDQNIVDIDGFKNNVDFMQMLPLKSTMLTHNTNNDSQDIENYHNDMGTTFEAPLFFSNGVENYQDIGSGDHQNYHLGCFAENIMNISHEYNNESGDQSQFMSSVVFQNLSTSTYQDGCIDQNMVNVDGNKNNVAFMQMLPLNSIMFTHNTNNGTQDIENYHCDMGTTFEPPLFFSNGIERCATSFCIGDQNFSWMNDKITTSYSQNEQFSPSFSSDDLDHHINTSFEWEFRYENPSFLQDNATGLVPLFSHSDKGIDKQNLSESNFKDNSFSVTGATTDNDLLLGDDYVNSSTMEDNTEFFSLLESFFSS
ncbi:serum factor response D-like [Carica papaya]|uniref:serum factor response D-like n=1 Tax=Carica papaya TaxID=3649 RepID=UPI000B8C70FB|nr:serum factor response D-like [Carica papaya]